MVKRLKEAAGKTNINEYMDRIAGQSHKIVFVQWLK